MSFDENVEKKNFNESREISIWIIAVTGTMWTMRAIGPMGTLGTIGTMENGKKLL